MSHQVALSFEDGVTRFISVEDGQTVADASYRHRINIPLDCRDGACGTCKAFCQSGDYDGGDYLPDALSQDEAEQGFCLPCQMTPTTDLVLDIASTSAVAKTSAATYQANVTALERLSSSTFALTLEVANRDDLGFLAGQYMNIAVPGTAESRSYSFANSPGEPSATFLMKFTPGGAMSTYLDERAAVGDRLELSGPNGSFFLREGQRPVLLLAGGTGLAPILSILRTLRDQGSRRRVRLIYGATTDDDVVRREEIEQVGAQLADFSWDYCVADPATTAEHQGYVTSLFDADDLAGGDVAVYLCGPPPMVDAVRSYLRDLGVEPHGFYFEKFALAAPTARDTANQPADTLAAELTHDVDPVQPVAAPGDTTIQPDPAVPTTSAPTPTAPTTSALDRPAVSDLPTEEVAALITAPQARRIAGQLMFAPPTHDLAPLRGHGRPAVDTGIRAIAGQPVFTRPDSASTTDDVVADVDANLQLNGTARSIAGQLVFGAHDLEPSVSRRPEPSPEPQSAPAATDADDRPGEDTGTGGYVIGEEHPGITDSDSVFEARQALELGALGLVIGRVDSQQIAGYRLLAEATVPYVDGDRFVDAARYTETNAAFHDYLFTLTGNTHLREAYERLGVQSHMATTLSQATWCHPRCTQDHLDIVDAVQAGDHVRARELFIEHADNSKVTTRRAMREADDRRRPAWVSPGRYAGQVVLVTGAAQGIGERVARRVCAEGGLVMLADRSELVAEVARDAADLGPGTADFVIADLESYTGAHAAVAAALERHGRIDVAIHNVGGAICFKPFQEFTPEQIDAEITRSLMTTLYGCRAVLPHLIDAGSGTILNVSSIATGGIHRVPYAAAKGGVNAITRALAVEAAPHGVRVVGTAPGGTQAPQRRIPRGAAPHGEQEQAWFQAHIEQTLDSALLHRYGSLDEQAAAITFLASREAAYITGSVLPVGGGDLG